MNQLHLTIHGQVQGVFFRDTACQKAREFGLTGWVKNCPDKTVEILVEGEKEDLKKMLKWCKEGSEYAKVEKVIEEWKEVEESEFGEFKIVY